MVRLAPAGPSERCHGPLKVARRSLSSLRHRLRWSTAKAHRLPSSTVVSRGESKGYLDSARPLHTLDNVMASSREPGSDGQSFRFAGAAFAAAWEA